jgi:hypothetical protein
MCNKQKQKKCRKTRKKTEKNLKKPTTFFKPETETDPDQKPTFEQKTDPDPDRSQKINPEGVQCVVLKNIFNVAVM